VVDALFAERRLAEVYDRLDASVAMVDRCGWIW
jgi:hypothetical protein